MGAYRGYGDCGGGILLETFDLHELDDSHSTFVYQGSCWNGQPEVDPDLGYCLLRRGAVAAVSATIVGWFRGGTWAAPYQESRDVLTIGQYYVQYLVQGFPAGWTLSAAGGGMGPTRLLFGWI
jgi:hypothetical protein